MEKYLKDLIELNNNMYEQNRKENRRKVFLFWLSNNIIAILSFILATIALIKR